MYHKLKTIKEKEEQEQRNRITVVQNSVTELVISNKSLLKLSSMKPVQNGLHGDVIKRLYLLLNPL